MPSPFLKLFGKSPFQPLSEHVETALHAVKLLQPFFIATFANNWQQAKNIQQEISDFEHQADELKRDLRLSLPKNLFLPVARGDLLELLSHQDHLANTAKDIAGLVLGRKMVLPEIIQQDYLTCLDCSIDAAKQAFKSTRELNDLYEAGFSGRETEIVDEMISHLHDIEHKSDETQITLRRIVFEQEAHLPPVNVIFIYKIIELTGMIADHAQKIGDRLQICIAK